VQSVSGDTHTAPNFVGGLCALWRRWHRGVVPNYHVSRPGTTTWAKGTFVVAKNEECARWAALEKWGVDHEDVDPDSLTVVDMAEVPL
jgi:hypothetical protein